MGRKFRYFHTPPLSLVPPQPSEFREDLVYTQN